MTAVVIENQRVLKDAQRVVKQIAIDEHPAVRVISELTDSGDVELSSELSAIVLDLLRNLASGCSVKITASPEVLSTSEAARILGISRPTLMKLIRSEDISSFKVGSHNRLHRSDVLSFLQRTEKKRAKAFEDLRDLEDELEAS